MEPLHIHLIQFIKPLWVLSIGRNEVARKLLPSQESALIIEFVSRAIELRFIFDLGYSKPTALPKDRHRKDVETSQATMPFRCKI